MALVQVICRPSRSDGWAACGLVATAFIWGSLVPIIGALRDSYDPLTILLLRYLPAQPILLLAVILAERRWPFAGPMPWARVLHLSSFGMLGFSALHTLGIVLSDPVIAAVVTNFAPLTAALVAKQLTGAALPRGLGYAMILAIVGGALVVTGTADAGPRNLHGGEVLLVASQVCWTWYSIKAQAWLAPIGFSQLRIAAVTSGLGSILLVAAYPVVLVFGALSLPAIDTAPVHVAVLLWVGIAGSGVGLLFWNAGVSRLGVAVATLYLNLIPIFAVLVAAAYGAPISLQQALGGLLVIAGVIQMQARRLRTREG